MNNSVTRNYNSSYIHISEANKKALKEIEERRKGKSSGLKTRWKRLNKVLGGGIQWEFTYLIAGLSGSGKTSLSNLIETDLFDLNPDEKFKVLNFNFETESYRNVIKKYSADLSLNTNEILSVEESLSDENFNKLKFSADRLSKYEIYYFDKSGSIEEIYNAIISFQNQYPEHRLINILDHTALVDYKNEKDELELLTKLAKMAMVVKKQIGCTNIFLGQLNSNIEQYERISSPASHAPIRSDLFGAKSIFNATDTVIVSHRPEQLNIAKYLGKYETKDKLFFHVIKNRYGDVGFLKMAVNFSLNSIEEDDNGN